MINLFALVIAGIMSAMPAHDEKNLNARLSIQATAYILADYAGIEGIDRSGMDTEMDTSDMDPEMDTSDMDTEMDTSDMDPDMD